MMGTTLLASMFAFWCAQTQPDDYVLLWESPPPRGAVSVPFTAEAGGFSNADCPSAWSILDGDGAAVPFQYDDPLPGEARGTLTFPSAPQGPLLRLAAETRKHSPTAASALRISESSEGIRIDNGHAEIFYSRAAGGLPAAIRFAATGRIFTDFRWNDRVWCPEKKGFLLREDPQARVRILVRGPYRAVVEVVGRYGGTRGASTRSSGDGDAGERPPRLSLAPGNGLLKLALVPGRRRGRASANPHISFGCSMPDIQA